MEKKNIIMDLNFLDNYSKIKIETQFQEADQDLIKFVEKIENFDTKYKLEMPTNSIYLIEMHFLLEIYDENGEIQNKCSCKNNQKIVLFQNVQKFPLGIHFAVQTMKSGEESWFQIPSEFWLPKDGKMRFVKILIHSQNKNWQLDKLQTPQLWFEYLEYLQVQSKQLFLSNEKKEAFKQYKKVMNTTLQIPKYIVGQFNEDDTKQFNEKLNIFYGNAAQCKLLENDWATAKEILIKLEQQIGESNIRLKNNFRKAKAEIYLNNIEEAIKILNNSLLSQVSNEEKQEIEQLLKLAESKTKKYSKVSEAKLFQEVFRQMPEEEMKEIEEQKQKKSQEKNDLKKMQKEENQWQNFLKESNIEDKFKNQFCFKSN